MVIYLNTLNKTLWAIAISLILLNSIYFSLKLRFPQFHIFSALKSINKHTNKENISPRDTLIMALSSKIGVGSLSGTALCIYYGGIGSIFWVFLSTFFLSIITYIENALAIIYKDKDEHNPKSGPQYYITKGLNKKILSIVYSFLVLISYTFLFTSIQSNTITTLTKDIYGINRMTISLIIAIISGLIIVKGIKGISNMCNRIFPIMMTIFIFVGLFIIIKNINLVPGITKQIIKDAFNQNSAQAGILYTLIIAIQKTVFANESGVGTSAIISGSTQSNDYLYQAKTGLIQTYFINFIVLGITSFIIITAGVTNLNVINGIELTKASFLYHLGTPGEFILLFILTLFSFSTIITIYCYGESSLTFITKNKNLKKLLKIFTIVSIFFGGIIKATAIWSLIDIFIAILTIINMYAIYKLKNVIILKLSKK